MRSHPVWARGTSARWQVWLMTVALCLFGVPVEGEARDLRDTITSLWPDGIRLQPTAPPFPSHEPHFRASSLQGLDSLNTSLASSLGFLSLNSSASSFTFDIERGVPVRTTDSLGPLLAERAPTLGRGKFDLALTYTRIEFSRFQGRPLDKLTVDFQHEDSNGNGIRDTTGPFSFESDVVRANIKLSIKEDIWALFGTYGITRNWDVGIVVPIIHIQLRAVGDATVVRNSPVSQFVHNFGPDSSPSHVSGGGDKTGIGDILLRTKYNFLRNQGAWPDLAVLGQVKLPSGDPDNLLGTGHTNFLPMLVASKTYGFLTPHVNAGYELTTGPREDDNLRYIVGFDTRLHPRLTVATDLLGRWEPNRNGNGSHILDLAFGLKWNPVGSFLVGGYAQIPLNRNEGLRANVIWSLAAEYIF
ncbi:MAG TPA: transporter [Candidatus Binatia bacterium]|nr:transporter [Candidatus Binatia bacterium]